MSERLVLSYSGGLDTICERALACGAVEAAQGAHQRGLGS